MSEQVHHLPDPQAYAVAQERQRHDGALYSFGEYAIFVLMWNFRDHEEGLVDRCPTCFKSFGKVAETYGQSAMKDCLRCFGTTFDGGFKARIVRPSLWDFNEADTREHNRGMVEVATASIQTTGDFRLRTGDIIIRADDTRWQMRSIGTNHLRTGFQMPSGQRTAVGYNYGQVSREDPSTIYYRIPPAEAQVKAALDVWGVRTPQDFSAIETIRGPLQ